jgi:hypothetical protein
MEQYLVAMVLIVVLADDDMAHPTAWSHDIGMTVNNETILLIAPEAIFANEVMHTGKLP